MEEKNYSKVPVFENGLAQPVFKFTDGKTGEKYDPATSSIVRYCVYVESDYDMDGDGKRDLVKAFIQVPRSAVEGNYKAATLYEARPYCAGVQADGYDHMKEVESKEYRKIDFADLDKEVPARIPEGMISAMDLALRQIRQTGIIRIKETITAWYMKIWITSIIIWCAALQWL